MVERSVPRRAKGAEIRTIVLFALVGIAATVVHAAIGIALVRSATLAPFWANVVAFLAAFGVSYSGHYNFSFASRSAHSDALPKFFAIALIGLAMNQAIVLAVVQLLDQPYELALAVVFLVVPASTFVLARSWAFGSRPAAT